ncbi:MAG: glycosyltransferase [Nitrospiraceae bacterium]|nr:MAG: glycosyltransferase [Nitrospiraceae bacterium]
MNISSFFEAHRNPLIRVMEWIEKRQKSKARGVPERLIAAYGKGMAAILPVLFFMEELINKLYLRVHGKKDFCPAGNRKKEVSVVILNWNGREMLSQCLTRLESALRNTTGEHEVIVVDNGSTDGSVEMLKKEFPRVIRVELKKNMGFSKGNNKGIKAANKDLIMLLNNDILLSEETFSLLLHHFDDNKVFAVAPKVVLEDGSLNEGHSWGDFREGIMRFYNERQSPGFEVVKKPSLTLYPIGACAIMDRKLYLDMGGLDPMFSPFYWEDDDLGYRAFKRGYKVMYDPRVAVIHKNAASSNKLPRAYTTAIKEKNMLLFLWKNLTYRPYLKEYLGSIPRRVSLAVERGNYLQIASYLVAFLQIFEVLRRRIRESPWIRLSDKEALFLTRKERREERTHGHKPHILIVTPFTPFPLNNGGAMRIYNLTSSLKDRYDFSLVSFIESRAQFDYIDELKKVFKNVHLVERKPTPDEGILRSEIPDTFTHYISYSMRETIEDILRKDGIDIVQVEFPWMAYYGRLVNNHPAVFVEHDVGAMFYGKGFAKSDKGLERYLSPLKAINYEKNHIYSYDKVISVTDEDRQYLDVLFPDISVTSVEQGVDTDAFPYQYSNSNEKNLVYLGHYKHYPNEDAVVHFVENILPLIKAKHGDVKFYIVGSHPTRRINRLRVREDIVITGSVADVNSYLAKGTVFVAPVRLGRGLKGKLLEAMAVGIPVVASPVAAAGIHAENGKEIFIASAPDEFASKVSALFMDKMLREKISLNARRLIEEKFDWKVLAGKMTDVYSGLL